MTNGKKKRAIRSVVSTFVLTVFAILCAEPAHSFVVLTSVESDKKAGNEVAHQVEREIGLYDDSAMTKLLGDVGRKLVHQLPEKSPFTFTFQVVDQKEPNAFALPGGHIYFSRGLLALVDSEDELAGVLGHEIIHVTHRHSAKSSRRGLLPGILTLPGRIVGVFTPGIGALVSAPFEVMGGMFMAKYSRKHENEADREGLKLAARAGYQPNALATILESMDRVIEANTGQEHKFSFFDSHPMTPDRAESIRKEAKKVNPATTSPVSGDRKTFLRRWDGLVLGENPAQGVFQKNQFLHPDLEFALEFPAGWKTDNRPIAVLAQSPKEDSVLIVQVSGKQGSPQKAAEAFLGKYRKETRSEPARNETLKWGAKTARLVTIQEGSRRSAVYYHFLWVEEGGRLFEIVGAGSDDLAYAAIALGKSLRSLRREERASITVRRMRVITGKRTRVNRWTPEMTRLVNRLETSADLSAEQFLKIAVDEPYKK